MTPEQASEAPAGLPTTREMTFGDFAFNATFSEVSSCPNGVSPTERRLSDTAYYATFPGSSCATCPFAKTCITRRVAQSDDRTLRWRDTKAATATRQRAQQTPAFKEGYKLRSGIESTNAELKRGHGLGDVRVRGGDRVGLAVVLTSLALNVKRAVQHHTEHVGAALDGAPRIGMVRG